MAEASDGGTTYHITEHVEEKDVKKRKNGKAYSENIEAVKRRDQRARDKKIKQEASKPILPEELCSPIKPLSSTPIKPITPIKPTTPYSLASPQANTSPTAPTTTTRKYTLKNSCSGITSPEFITKLQLDTLSLPNNISLHITKINGEIKYQIQHVQCTGKCRDTACRECNKLRDTFLRNRRKIRFEDVTHNEDESEQPVEKVSEQEELLQELHEESQEQVQVQEQEEENEALANVLLNEDSILENLQTLEDLIESLTYDQRKALCIKFQLSCSTALADIHPLLTAIFNIAPQTLYKWHSQYQLTGQVISSNRGKHAKVWSALLDENFRELLRKWLREHKMRKGQKSMTRESFAEYVNTQALPKYYPHRVGEKISEKTASNWMRLLGFIPSGDIKKGVYIDGHERDDVVKYREYFVQMYQKYILQGLNPIFQDESVFMSNDGQRVGWIEQGDQILRKKSMGSGIMVSEYITRDGYLELSDEQWAKAKLTKPNIPQRARLKLEYGKTRDGYFESKEFLQQLSDAADIYEFLHPETTGLWIFDHSSVHKKKADDALNASRMNLSDGGKQPKQRDTEWKGNVQTMTTSEGLQKGLKTVLMERGLWKEKMKKTEAAEILEKCDDFAKEQCMAEKLLRKRGHYFLLLPKFHCEFNPTELVWCMSKYFARSNCGYNITSLRKVVDEALAHVKPENIRNFFVKAEEYMEAYREGNKGEEILKFMKEKKSHRRMYLTQTQ